LGTAFLEPTTIDEAAALVAQYGDDAKIIAGGASLVLLLSHRIITPAVLVSLGRIADYNFIRREPDGLHIGALTHLRDAERSTVAREFCPALARAYGVVGNVRVRNQGTVGGNLGEADFASDPPAMLAALDARVSVANTTGTREIPLRDFFLGFFSTALQPGEIITQIFVPALPATARAAYFKFTAGSNESRPTAAVAAVADIGADNRCRELRVAIGAAVETPQRLPPAEAMARGGELTDAVIGTIAEEYARTLEPIDDAFQSAWYRREVIRVFVRRALTEVRDGNR
jgi:carbon-monoxide dehydrogenase medium subunit